MAKQYYQSHLHSQMFPAYPSPQHVSSQEPFYGDQELSPPPPLHPLSSSSFLLPSPTLDYGCDQLLFPAHNFRSETLEALLQPVVMAPVGDEETLLGSALPPSRSGSTRARKRPFRTDRHSKIRTAQGVRDRRMRLSLDVAREFFALQDRLGFDKASQTVDWLLTQSKPAIERLSGSPSPKYNVAHNSSDVSMSSTSECGDLAAISGSKGKGTEQSFTRCATSLDQTQISKDAREKARARARQRTMEKMQMRDDGSENGCELDRFVAAPLDRLLHGNGIDGMYYYFGEMMNHLEEDDAAYEEKADFFDGMQF